MYPLVQRLRVLRKAEGLSRDEHSRRAGLGRNTMISWEDRGVIPNVANLEAAFGVLGYELKIAERRKVAPLRGETLEQQLYAVLLDNRPRRWTATELFILWPEQTPKKISNTLLNMRRSGRVRFNGKSYAAVEEKT